MHAHPFCGRESRACDWHRVPNLRSSHADDRPTRVDPIAHVHAISMAATSGFKCEPLGDQWQDMNTTNGSVDIDMIQDDGSWDEFGVLSTPSVTSFSSMGEANGAAGGDRSSTLSIEGYNFDTPVWDPLASPMATPRLSELPPSPYVFQPLTDRESGTQLRLPSDRASRRMSLHDLHQLRELMVKSQHTDTVAEEPLPSRPIVQPPSMHFIPVTRQISTEKSDFESANPRKSSSSRCDKMLPRESVAVLIDAVRASTLTDDAKCRFLFDLFDVTKRGMLSRAGITAFIDATLTANSVQCKSAIQLHQIVDKLFASGQNEMTYADFQRVYASTVGTETKSKNATSKPFSQPPPSPPPAHGDEPDGDGRAPSIHFRASHVGQRKDDFWTRRVVKPYRKYDAEVHCLTVYLAMLATAFWAKASSIAYDPAVGYAACIAKGFAQVAMVDTCFVLLPMCRYLVTSFRTLPWVRRWIPIDRHVDFHKVCGIVMLVASLGHSVAWIAIVSYLRTVPQDVWQRSQYAHLVYVREETALELLQRVPVWSGFAMLLLAAIAAPLAHTSTRRRNFNAFWLTHLLLLPFLLLILVHGLAQWLQPPQAFYWILPPCAIYFIEKWYRRSRVFGGKTAIQRVQFSQDTAAIYLLKPASFTFLPGMYLYLNMPAISRFEWHPFTISSAPEDEYITINVRKAGDWTSALHQRLRDVKPPRDSDAGSYPPVYIDGPIGAPSQDYSLYESVVFIGAGTGVTPLASILRSIVHQWEAYRCECCQSVTLPRRFQVKKIYLYWITSEQEELAWFSETMNQLSALDTDGRLELHTFFTQLKDEATIAPLRALQTFVHEAEGQDIVSGLTTKHVTRFGRPEWRQELAHVADQVLATTEDLEAAAAPSTGLLQLPERQVGVFFCGPKAMGKDIHNECEAFTNRKRGVAFDFRSEQF